MALPKRPTGSLLLAGMLLFVLGCVDTPMSADPTMPADSLAQTLTPNSPSRPNILLIVADDLGYTDLGAFGGEIETPNLDTLARQGLRLTNFHAGPSCAPTRAMLLTGTDNHLAGMGSQGTLATPLQSESRAYLNRLLPEVPTIAEHLQALGYATLASAKWHLGHEAEHLPQARGFDRSFVLLEGGGGHFDDTPLFEAYGKAHWLEDDQPVELPENFYSSDYMTDKLIEYVGGLEKKQPFFAYLGFTAPHWPLQAPAQDIARYRGRYAQGWQALHRSRLEGAKREGVVDGKTQGVTHEPGVVAWESLSPQEQLVAQARMEVYAAMIDRLDQNIGRLIARLASEQRLHNTIIVFIADNGAEAHPMELYSNNPEWIPKHFDNALANIGRGNSYVTLGPSWARATVAPFRDSKSKLAEGGIRVPAFVHIPKTSGSGIDTSYMRVMDLAPTFIELAGGSAPSAMMGRSLLARWRGAQSPYAEDEVVAAETYDRRLVQRGPWKLLSQPAPYGTGAWQLYNLATDLGEQQDLAAEYPELVAELIEHYNQYASDVGVIEPETPIRY